MTKEIAKALTGLEPRLSSNTQTDPWALVWQLAVGATYSLTKAQALLPGSTDPTEFRNSAVEILNGIVAERAPDLGRFPTWSLGFYLNSTEARIQAAVHRLLRAYTGKRGYGPELVADLQRLSADQQPPQPVMEILGRIPDGFVEDDRPGGALARVWERSNSVKHDPAQDVSDQFAFNARWRDCRTAIREVIVLLELLATHRGAIAAA